MSLGAPGPDPRTADGTVHEDLSAVTITEHHGTHPTVHVPVPFGVSTTRRRVLRAGHGPGVSVGQRIDVRYVGLNGTTGTELDVSWDTDPRSFLMDSDQNLPGLVGALTGTRVGSRVLLAVAPQDGFGSAGSSADGIGPDDTLVVLVDVLSARTPLARADGPPVPTRPGLPAVTRGPTGRPTITVPRTPAPAALVSHALLRGTGPAVRAGDTVTVHFTGVVWATGRRFDSSWDRGHPETFTIGNGSVIDAWDAALPGHRVGSQVLLVVPPSQGFGPRGKPEVHVTGTDTLVFVVDILDAG